MVEYIVPIKSTAIKTGLPPGKFKECETHTQKKMNFICIELEKVK